MAPLALPDLAQIGSLEAVCRVSTVSLFLERAQRRRQTSQHDTGGWLAGGRYLRPARDGLPLAIELAAARTSHFGLRELHDRLAEPSFLGVLAEGPQDLADHQRTDALDHRLELQAAQ